MGFEVIVGAILIYALFGDYMSAAAKMLHEKAREKELENDEREFGHEDHSEDATGS